MKKVMLIICLVLALLASGCMETSNRTWEDFRIAKDALEQPDASAPEQPDASMSAAARRLKDSRARIKELQAKREELLAERQDLVIRLQKLETPANRLSRNDQKIAAWMTEARLEGVFSHVNENRCTVRVDPLDWISLSLEAKRELLRGCATYFKMRTGLYDATILSNRNDNKLADYSFLGAERIHY